jgi:hypothetical protein
MRLNLATRISTSILGVLMLALISVAVAVYAAWRVAHHMEVMVPDYVPAVRVAQGLEIALLEQRGRVGS